MDMAPVCFPGTEDGLGLSCLSALLSLEIEDASSKMVA